MSSFGDALGQSANWLSGKEGKFKTQSNIKNPALQKYIDEGIAGFGDFQLSGKNALKDYISKYLAGEGAAKATSGEEIADIDRYFSGAVGADLDRLRANRARALEEAALLGSDYALANVSRSRAMGEGGPSSYDRRLALRSIGDIRTQAALDRTAQERADYGWLAQQRLGLGGRRTALADALAGRALVPEGASRALYAQELGLLGNWGELDRANKFYGLKYEPSWGEQAGQHIGSLAEAAMTAYGGFAGGGMGGMGGMGGGGGGGYPQMSNFVWGSGYGAPPAGTWTNWRNPGGPTSMAPWTGGGGWF